MSAASEARGGGMMDGKAVTVTDMCRARFYDYEAKYGRAVRSTFVPAQIRTPSKALELSERGPPRLVAEALPDRTFVKTTLTTFWSFWR